MTVDFRANATLSAGVQHRESCRALPRQVEVCRAILALKIAEGFLLEPEGKKGKMRTCGGLELDLSVLEGEHAWSFIF